MLRPRPEPSALALVITYFISQLRIPQSRQRVRRNKLSFSRSKSLRIPSPSIVPLVRHTTRLVKPRRKHPLHVSFRSNQRLAQINHFPLSPSQSNQRPVPAHIFSCNPPRLPVPRPLQPRLYRISTLLLTLITLIILLRRIRKLFPRCLSRILPRIRRWLALLRPSQSDRHRTRHQQHQAGSTL